jgi:uncharacterized membrane protein
MSSVRRFRFLHFFRTRLWLLPLICVLAGIGGALALLAIDRASGYRLVGKGVTGSASSAQSVLTVASSALVTLTSVVLSLTLVAVQLAMGQFSPRIVRAILHDRRSQLAIGLFIGTFAYSMTVLRELNGKTSGSAAVPGLAISVDYALILCAIVALVLFVHHTGQSIRVGGLIGLVADETRKQIDRQYRVADEPVTPPDVVPAPACGIVVKLHHHALVDLAARAHCVLELVPALGDFVPRGSALFKVHGTMSRSLRDVAALGVILGRERTHDFEPAFGIRKLVDVAQRSIYSGPFQDPTTTVQAINALHDLLRRLAVREFPSGVHRDADGQPRLIERTITWEGYVRLTFDELRMVGAGSPQVARRLRAALEDILEVAPPERQQPLEHQLHLLEAGIRRAFEDEADVRTASVADLQGIGSGPDVMSAAGTQTEAAGFVLQRPSSRSTGAGRPRWKP